MSSFCAFMIGLVSATIAMLPIILSDKLNNRSIKKSCLVFLCMGLISGSILAFIAWAVKQ